MTQWLEDFFRNEIPPALQMDFSVHSYAENQLTLAAPLKANINDKNTGFGGSIYSLAVLCGWGLISIKLKEANISADIVIHKGSFVYKKPITDDFFANCEINEKTCQEMNDLSISKQKVSLEISVKDANGIAFILSANFVIIPK